MLLFNNIILNLLFNIKNLTLILRQSSHYSITDQVIGKGKDVALLCTWVLITCLIINIFYIMIRSQRQN